MALDALVSPTHLILLLGGVIGLTAPWRESPRAATAARPLTTVATLSTVVTRFEQPAAPAAALVAGLLAEFVARSTRGWPEDRRLLILGILGILGATEPAALWGAQLAAPALTSTLRWPAS